MSAQRKYPEELRERATRMAVEARRDPERSKGAIRRIADELGVHPEALRTWVKKAEIDGGARPGTTTSDWSTGCQGCLVGRVLRVWISATGMLVVVVVVWVFMVPVAPSVAV